MDEQGVELFPTPLRLRDLYGLFHGRTTIARIYNDYAAEAFLPAFMGRLMEIGSSKKKNYRRYATSSEHYIVSNLSPSDDETIAIDATNMDIPDASLDGIVCMNVLEHIFDYQNVVHEFYRVLAPKGKLLLTVPYMFPYHGAPDDFFRFSASALQRIAKDFDSVRILALGNHWHALALFAQRPVWGKGGMKTLPWPFRLLGICFCLLGRLKSTPDEYPTMYCVIAEKSH